MAECMRVSASGYCAVVGACVQVRVAIECECKQLRLRTANRDDGACLDIAAGDFSG